MDMNTDSAMAVDGAGERLSQALSDDLQAQHDDIMQAIQRDINVLGETTSDRTAKRRSLERINKETLGRTGMPPQAAARVLARVFAGIVRPVLRLVSDPVEKCRELSIQLVAGFARRVDSAVPVLPYVVPTIVARLSPAQILEPAEELRLLMVHTLVELVQATTSAFAPFVEDTIKALVRTLADPYPEVKKESCKLVVMLCDTNPRPVAFHGDAVAKAVLPTLHHRHSSVRSAGVDALAASVLVEASGLDVALDTLRAASTDKAPVVREALYRAARLWLLNLTDRYTYADKTLPLLLTGIADDMPKLRDLAASILDDVGATYEREWESRIKDELDYSDGWDHLPNRPRVGIRHLARDNMQKIIAKMVEGMNDWNIETRAKSAQILSVFLTLTEDQATGYIGTVLPALYKILAGDDQIAMDHATNVAKTIGLYIKPDITFSLLFPQLAMGAGGATQFRLGCLRTLHGLLSGISNPNVLAPRMGWLVETLCDRELVQSENVQILLEVDRCVLEAVSKISLPIGENDVVTVTETSTTAATTAASKMSVSTEGGNSAMMSVVPSESPSTIDMAFRIFMILLHMKSIQCDERTPGFTELRAVTNKALAALARSLGLSEPATLYHRFLQPSIVALATTHTEWTKHAVDLRLFDTLLSRAGPAVRTCLDAILPIMYSCTRMDREYEVRERIVMLMSRLARDPLALLVGSGDVPDAASDFNDSRDHAHGITMHSLDVIKMLVLPGCIWRAGHKASSLRMHSMDLFLALLGDKTTDTSAHPDRIGYLTTAAINTLLKKDVLPVIISNIEDDEVATRQTSLTTLERVLDSETIHWDVEDFKKVYPELLKRMDDAQDAIRIQCAQVWVRFFMCVARWQRRVAASDPSVSTAATEQPTSIDVAPAEVTLDDMHWQVMVKGLAIHMDDTNPDVQSSTTEALQTGARMCIPKLIVRDELVAVKSKHRSARFIDQVLAE